MEVAPRNEGVVDEKRLLSGAAQRQLIKEHGDIDGDDDPDPDGKARRGDVVTDRKHAARSLAAAAAPGSAAVESWLRETITSAQGSQIQIVASDQTQARMPVCASDLSANNT